MTWADSFYAHFRNGGGGKLCTQDKKDIGSSKDSTNILCVQI